MTAEVGQADVVVVGAGSSGAVAAARLSENPECDVVLLEAAPDFPAEATDPPAFLVGGSAMGENFTGAGAATAPADFAGWERLGARGWNWNDVLPHYRRVESEVPIRVYPPEAWQPIQHVFVEGFAELGFRPVSDMNEPDAWDRVVGAWPQNRRNEIRMGTLVTHVRPARARHNFRLIDRAVADRVLIAGTRATGVRYLRGGRPHEIEADTVIIAAGAYGSPALLQRSGLGPAKVLAAAGVTPIVDLPVGQRLRDHPQCPRAPRAPDPRPRRSRRTPQDETRFQGLRVADASVFPANTTNNPNLTCLMVGDRVADFVTRAPAVTASRLQVVN